MKNNFNLIFKFLLPSIFTNICIFFFGIIDGIFVGKGVGTNALGAVNIVFSFIMFSYALNVLTSFGGISLMAIAIGENKVNEANKYFNTSLFLTIVISLILTFLGVTFTKPISLLLGATKDYISDVCDYLFWISIFLIPNSLGICLEHFCRNDGEPNLVLYSTIISTILNIILDYLLIFPISLGIKGAAIATGISETVRFFIISIHYFKNFGILRISFFRPNIQTIKDILFQGSPEMISQFDTPITIMCMNQILGKFIGNIGINTYSFICYVASFTLSVMYGCSEGMQPLFGQSFGAQEYKRLKFFLKSGLFITTLGSIFILGIIIFFLKDLCHLYNLDQSTTNYVNIALPKYSWCYIIAGLNALISTFLYSVKDTFNSIILNICRSFFFNSICIILIPVWFGVNLIWYSKGISELFVLILGLSFLFKLKFFANNEFNSFLN